MNKEVLDSDYNSTKIGIEYHRVLSYNKLFCSCKYEKNEPFDIPFKVKYADEKVRTYYKSRKTCLYEQDQIPPILNRKILKKAVSIVRRIPNVKVLNSLIFSRKKILDGSVPSGYQISGVLAYGGVLTLSDSTQVLIDKINLEQDSCSDSSVNRLGLPLLEISTLPASLKPVQIKQVLLHLEDILNRFLNLPICSFARRQDVNISYRSHPKVEIKGFSSLTNVPKIIDLQIETQKKAIDLDLPLVQTTKYVDEADLSFKVLRLAQGKQRMSLETELGVQYLDESLETPEESLKIDQSKYQKMKNFLKNRKQLRKISKLDEKHNLDSADINLYCRLYYRKWPFKKLYSLFSKYLKNELSGYGIIVNEFCVPYTEDFLNKKYKQVSSADFFRNYKKFFPRRYKVLER